MSRAIRRPASFTAGGIPIQLKQQHGCRGWFVNAWRLVDANQQDMVQPWFNSKRDLREYASTANIYLIEA